MNEDYLAVLAAVWMESLPTTLIRMSVEQLLVLSNVSVVRLGSGLSIQQWFDSADTSGEPASGTSKTPITDT